MRRFLKGRRPSAAVIIASVALVFAVGGTAVAVVGLNAKQKKQVKKISKKQANKRITARAGNLSVANAANATNAQTAVVGAPRAYAEIENDGTVDTGSPSKGITDANVTNPSAGTYCFELPFAPQTAAGNGNHDGAVATDDAIIIYTLDPGSYLGCPATAEAEINYIDASDAALQSDDFNIQFDG